MEAVMAVKRPDTTLYAKIIADIWKRVVGAALNI
jgi:hypothetical protein